MNKRVVKLFMIFLFVVTLFTGCEEVPEKGIYKEGTYVGFSEYDFANIKFTTFATVYVNDLGIIKSISFDSTYVDGNVATTRKKEKNSFAIDEKGEMTNISWDDQAKLLEKAILKEQDLNFIKWTNEEKTMTDSIKGVIVPIRDLYDAVDNALKQAK